MKRPKLTIRTTMAIVLLIGALLGLGLPAVDVYRAKEYHDHLYVSDDPGGPAMIVEAVESPFWPRYQRRLLGRPWRGQPLCTPGPGHLEETCSLAHPEIVVEKGGGEVEHTYTLAQRQCYDRLKLKSQGVNEPSWATRP